MSEKCRHAWIKELISREETINLMVNYPAGLGFNG